MSVLIEPGHVTEYPLNHARILYGNAITAATATGARAKFPASAALTETTYERWSPAESGDSITLTFPSQNINAIALAAHSELQPTIEVRHNGAFIDVTAYPTNDDPSLISDFTTDTHQLLNYSPDNQAILFLLKPRRIDAIRITVTYSGTAPTLGVVRAGNVLEMMRPFYQGHNPAILAADNTLRPNVSESGEWLGASLIRQGRSVKMDWQNIASSWVREKWTPFSKTIKTSPFIIAWNAKKFSTDVFYCSSSDTPQPTHSGPRDLMAVSLSARGYSDGTEPEVLNLANSTFDNLFTFTRASAATIQDVSLLREVGVDVPRLVEYDGAGGAQGLLLEIESTNLLEYPRRFDNPVWRQDGATLFPSAAVAPDGMGAAYFLRENNTLGPHAVLAAGVVLISGGSVGSASIHVQASGKRYISFSVGYFNAEGAYAVFDLQNNTVYSVGEVGGFTDATAGIEFRGGGWYKIHLSFLAGSFGSRKFYVSLLDDPDDAGVQPAEYQGDGVSGIYIWHAQLEADAFSSSVIPNAATFTSRATTAKFMDSGGLLQTAAIDAARTDAYVYLKGFYYPVGLLLENVAENLLTNNRNPTTGDWFNAGSPSASQDETGIDGAANTAWTLGSTDGDGDQFRQKYDVLDNSEFQNFSAYFKKVTNPTTYPSLGFVLLNGSTPILTEHLLNPETGETIGRTGIGDLGSARTTELNGWWRFEVSLANNSTGNNEVQAKVVPAASNVFDGSVTTGITGSAVYDFGQAEQNSHATSPIETGGSPVTRAADISASPATTRASDDCARALGAEFNPLEGSIYVEFKVLAAAGSSSGAIVSLNDGTNNNRMLEIRLTISNELGFFTTGFGSNEDFSYVVGQTYRVAVSVDSGTLRFAVDGVPGAESGALTATGINQMELGVSFSEETRRQNIEVKDLRYFPSSKTAAELITLTGG